MRAAVGLTRSYELLHRVARGGMAELFLARTQDSLGMDRHCVVKRIRRDRQDDLQYIQMFLEEARVTAALQHPNTATVLDCGIMDGAPFLALEHIHGATVRDIIRHARATATPLPLGVVLSIIAGCAAGLHHAHERRGPHGAFGIVHGDVSPSNLMVSYEGVVKVVDFGVAKTAMLEPCAYEAITGKVGYMSPEQCRRQRIDRRSDLYSLGVVMWELLVGRRLYDTSEIDQMLSLTEGSVPPPSAFRQDLPRALDAIVVRLLARDPEDRYTTGADLIEAIERFAEATSTSLSPSALTRFMAPLSHNREPWVDPAELPTETQDLTATRPERVTVVVRALRRTPDHCQL